MTQIVANVRAERNEAIQAAIDSIGKSKVRRQIFEHVYFGKKQLKPVAEIAKAIRLSEKHVLTAGKRLVNDDIIHETKVVIKGRKKIAYKKIAQYTAHKPKVLAGLKNPKKSVAKYPTKQRPAIKAVAVERVIVAKNNVPKQVTIDDIASFAKARTATKPPARDFKKLPELTIKQGFRKILGQADSKKDWGGETNDLFSGKLKYRGSKRIGAAFAFKGKGTQGQLTPAKMGKNGDQIARLFGAPAQMFFVVYPREIAESVLDQMRAFAFARAKSGEKIYYCIIGDDDFARLYHAYPAAFGGKKGGK